MAQNWLEKRLDELPKKNKAGLARALSLPPTRVSDLVKGRRRIQADEWQPMANYLEWTVDQLLRAAGGEAPIMKPQQVSTVPLQTGTLDLPVYRCTPRGEGMWGVDPVVVAMAERPPFLRYSQHAFGVYCFGTQQSPAYEPGDLLIIDPNKPAKIGDDCLIVQGFNITEIRPFVGILRRLMRETDATWTVRQFNPDQEYELTKVEWPRALPVVGKYNR